MPLIQIRRQQSKIDATVLFDIIRNLHAVAAKALTCEESGELVPGDIMIEADDMNTVFGSNLKDIHIRVWAHDYPSRRDNLDAIRKRIADEVLKHLVSGTSWYVWVLLAPTSYGSDTEEK